jgi:hypothetical protein
MRRGSPSRRRRLRRAEVFFPYFDVRARFDTAEAQSALAPSGIKVPPLPSYFDALVDFAVAADWGRRPLSRVDARASLGQRRPARPRGLQPIRA